MDMRSISAGLCLVVLSAAAPAPDPLLDRIIAGARAVPADSIGFERSSRSIGQDEGKAPETNVRVDRWDGQQLTLVSVNGSPATPEKIAEQKKAFSGRPVPGYHRIAEFLKGGAHRLPDNQGRILYRIDKLPKGSINIGKDVSENLVADLLIDNSGNQPYVSRMHIFLPKPLSFFFVAKLDSFDVVNEYRPGPGGRPALLRTTQSLAGVQLGKSGNTRTESTFTPLK